MKAALVTGAAQGLGKGIALALASAGYDIGIVDLDQDVIEGSATDIRDRGVRAVGLVGDVSDRAAVDRCVEQLAGDLGRIDVLVNNAQGGLGPAPFVETTVENLERTWRSGFGGTFHCMQAAFPHLRATGGCVINLVSGAALSATPRYSVYASTKAAIRTLTRVTALEWGPLGIRVNALSPSAATPALIRWSQTYPEEYAERAKDIPLGRFGDPEQDVGRVAVFLASDAAGYITGQTIVADGGAHYLG